MDFGTIETTRLLDELGSVLITEINMHQGKPNKPLRHRLKYKKRVHNDKEEHEQFLRFSDEILKDKKKKDPTIEVQRTDLGDKNGYYYIVTCYTILEY